MRLAVIGASGMLGSAVVAQARARGHEVVGFDRQPSRDASVESHVVDIRDAGTLRLALGRFDGVVNTASLVDLHLGKPKALDDINVTGAKNIVAACHANDIAKLVHMSSAEVISGPTPLRGATESTSTYPARQLTHYGETKKQGEQLVLGAADARLGTCVMRTYGLFGPDDNTVVPLFLRHRPKTGGRYIGDLEGRTDVVYAPNVAHAMLLAVEQLEPTSVWSGSPFHITDDDPVNLQTFLAKLVSVLGYRMADRPALSRRAAQALAVGFELRYRLTKADRWARPPLTRHSLRLGLDDYWLDSSKARTELEYAPAFSRTEAIAETQVWLQKRYAKR